MDHHQSIINETIVFVRQELANAEGGHDWWHIERVWKTAQQLSKTEDCNILVVELAALLHDIADSKFHQGDEEIGPKKAGDFLHTLKIPVPTIEHIVAIIRNISFKGGKQQQTLQSKELDIVMDADRLDAIGAIGIARTFNYGGFKNRSLYDPSIPPNLSMSKEEYKNSTAPTLNHFYEKLLLLKNLMRTETGKKMAEQRHRFMETYLVQFYAEWSGNR
jgi:uncharacterized protein